MFSWLLDDGDTVDRAKCGWVIDTQQSGQLIARLDDDDPEFVSEIRRLMARRRVRVVKQVAVLFFAVVAVLVVILAAFDLVRNWPPATGAHSPAVVLKKSV